MQSPYRTAWYVGLIFSGCLAFAESSVGFVYFDIVGSSSCRCREKEQMAVISAIYNIGCAIYDSSVRFRSECSFFVLKVDFELRMKMVRRGDKSCVLTRCRHTFAMNGAKP